MKYLIVLMMLLTLACDRVDPEVSTLYLGKGTREELRDMAVESLYNHYSSSARDRSYYEVISKKDGRFILNYSVKNELLTLCGDPGSGWSGQYKVDLVVFEKLVRYGATFSDLQGFTDRKFDSLLVEHKPFFTPKTNGSPSI